MKILLRLTLLLFGLLIFNSLTAKPFAKTILPNNFLPAGDDSLLQKEVKKFHFKIGLPPGWSETAEAEKGNKSFVAVSESEAPEDSFIENIYVLNFKNIDDKLKSYYKDYFNRTKFSASQFHKTEEGEEEINGEKARFFAYTCDYHGISLKVLVYIMLKNKTSYVFTAVALESTYEQYKNAFRTMARSIKID